MKEKVRKSKEGKRREGGRESLHREWIVDCMTKSSMPLSPGVNCIRDGQERRVNEIATILVKVMQSVQRGQFNAERERGCKARFL